METFCYYIEDMKLTFKGDLISPRRIRMICCGLSLLFGLPMVFKGGFQYFNLINEFTLAVPLAFVNTCNIFIWIFKSKFDSLMSQVSNSAGESEPKWIFFLLKTVNFPFSCFLLGLGIFDLVIYINSDI